MIGKVIFWLLFFTGLAIIAFQVYELLPREAVGLIQQGTSSNNGLQFNYGTTPVFGENMRFNHNDITYHISSSCSRDKNDRMVQAFDIFEDSFDYITFIPISQVELADIRVFCSNNEVSLGNNLYTVGEGGPSRIINTSQFKVIEEGTISLYKETSRCNYPVVELHELLHVFGFDHTANPSSIMYNVSDCKQRITPDMVNVLNDLYAIDPYPDLVISDLSANKRGRYLDFNITVLNEGLLDSGSFEIALLTRGEVFETFDIEEIRVGHGRTIRATNVRLPSLRVESLNFEVDYYKAVTEFNEDNNLVQMRVKGG